MKKNAFARICIWSLVAMLMIAGLFAAINGSYASNDSRSMGAGDSRDSFITQSEATISADESRNIREIYVYWVSGTVDVEFYDGGTIEFDETANRALQEKETMRYRVKGNRLSIEFSDSSKNLLSINTPQKHLTLRIPTSLSLDSLGFENVSSTMQIHGNGAYVSSVDIETVSGPVTMDGLSGHELDLEAVSASVDITGQFMQIDSESVSGSLRLALAQAPESVDAESVSGSITFVLPPQIGFTAELDTLSGSISSNYAEILSRTSARHGDGAVRFKLSTVSGSASFQQGESIVNTPAKPETVTPAPTEETADRSDPIPSSNRKF